MCYNEIQHISGRYPPMKLTSSQMNILRTGITVFLRVLVTAAAVIGLACFALAMILNMVFNGPSVTARNELTLTLLANESTRDIPSHFLSQQTIDGICAVAALPDVASDPAMITVGSGETGSATLTGSSYTATVTLSPADAGQQISGSGAYYAGFTAEGVLVVSATDAAAFPLSACDQILMMNGRINESLFSRDSGYAARTAIGQRADGTLILVTASGGTADCPGATYQDLINIMTEYGAVNACCLRSGNASEE